MASSEDDPISSDHGNILAASEDGRSPSCWFDYPHNLQSDRGLSRSENRDEPKRAMTPLPEHGKPAVQTPLKPKGNILINDGPTSLASSTVSDESRIDVYHTDSQKKEISLATALSVTKDCMTPSNRISVDFEHPPQLASSTPQESTRPDKLTLTISGVPDPPPLLQNNSASDAHHNFGQSEVRSALGPDLLPRIVTCHDKEGVRESDVDLSLENSGEYGPEAVGYHREGLYEECESSCSSTGDDELIKMEEGKGQRQSATGVNHRTLSPCGRPSAAPCALPTLRAPSSTVQVESETAMDRGDSPWYTFLYRYTRKEKCDEVEDIESPRSEKLRRKTLYEGKYADIWAYTIMLIICFVFGVGWCVLQRMLHLPSPPIP